MTPSLPYLARVFGRIGILSFGGPAAQIALMHRVLVEDEGWIEDRRFLDALGFCMMLPGPEAMQLATWCGWRLRGVPGGLIAGGLFVLPGALVVGALALLYAAFGTAPQAVALMLGVKAAVIAIVAQALIRLAGKALTGRPQRLAAVLAFAAIFVLNLPFPLIVLAAGAWGWLGTRASETPATPWPAGATSLRRIAAWITLWLAPLAVLAGLGQELLLALGLFFAKLAVVTFGGAYAVLAYMSQEVVSARHWLDAAQMVDALGLAETTPGPLILVTQFVGMLTGYSAGGWGMALVAGLVTLWMTFVPCFLWIFAGAPYLDAVTSRARPAAALAMISAAVVGVILNLALWFSLHVLFVQVQTVSLGPFALPLPVLHSLSPTALALAVLAFGLVFGARRGPLLVVPVMGFAGWLGGLI
ncbi:chromate efflux transporter [Mesobacterium sp. TK19101]|uniref:Chromate efflux transporter n=1 Tax=Mesobacterium hydrothermale TaxID=3111907 RepID=A0ABU6HCI7_9RHOB|nr:chromate efflux transporter [Mesobacterium sp. TK19101]MEC3860182.1 chromate efflux transporter [Mesobacterium sp. TK19101]